MWPNSTELFSSHLFLILSSISRSLSWISVAFEKSEIFEEGTEAIIMQSKS